VALFRRSAFLSALLITLAGSTAVARAQDAANKPADKAAEQAPTEKEKTGERPQLPFQIQLLETHVRFEANGNSHKEVHTVVKIINILGVQQFGRISFDYNRGFQQVEIPLVRIRHANGGTSEVLPSAVTDVPNPAVEQFPTYQNVRVKSVRILGLQEGDTIEYKVVTTTTNQPLAPDFWLEHTFDRSGQVLEEHYEVELPSSRKIDPRINPATPVSAKENTGSGETACTTYRWTRKYTPPADGATSEDTTAGGSGTPDVGFSTLSWEQLAARLAELMMPGSKPLAEMKTHEESMKEVARRPEVADLVREKAVALTRNSKSDMERLKALYEFVATKINTTDIPLGATGFRARPAVDVLNSGYANGEDKYALYAALGTAVNLRADAVLTGFCDRRALAIPTVFKHLVILGTTKERQYWMDPAVEVAPFGMISPSEAKCALLLRREFPVTDAAGQEWIKTPTGPPFAAFQRVGVDAVIADDGQLTARVKYVLRGENELLLRVAFHQTPKEKWKDIGGLLAISDGFRGQVTNVEASDPLATEEPFIVGYELTQLKFVDWTKKPVRIPALLPQIGLPDPVVAPVLAPGKVLPKIQLGTPLDVQTSMTLRLPAGTRVQTPAGTSMDRDYGKYMSKYSSTQNTAVASRHIDFLKREVPGDQAQDYNAFFRSVQSDQGQRFVLVREASAEEEGEGGEKK
jgi:Domain of Unknown Function with PDB structure (DUF3857)